MELLLLPLLLSQPHNAVLVLALLANYSSCARPIHIIIYLINFSAATNFYKNLLIFVYLPFSPFPPEARNEGKENIFRSQGLDFFNTFFY